MAKRSAPQPISTVLPVLPANELWAYDDTTDRAFTIERTARDRLIKETKATIAGHYTIPNGGSFLPAWQLAVKRECREQAKQILGVIRLAT